MNEKDITNIIKDIPENPEPFIALSKELSNDTAEKMKEAVELAKKAGFTIGVEVTRTRDAEVGKVIGHNETIGGFYPGSRYPIIVQFPSATFQYAQTDLELLRNKK